MNTGSETVLYHKYPCKESTRRGINRRVKRLEVKGYPHHATTGIPSHTIIACAVVIGLCGLLLFLLSIDAMPKK